MNDLLKMRTLTERFFDGETTLDEEQQLYELYRRDDLPADLRPMQLLFCDMAALPIAGEPGLPARTPRYRWAATLLVLLAGAATLLFSLRQQQAGDECVCYMYGEKVTNPTVVLAEVHRSMGSIADDNLEGDVVDTQLKEMFCIN